MESEIAEELGIGIAEYHGFLNQYSRPQVASLEACLEIDGQPGIEYCALVEDAAAVDPQFHTNLVDLRAQLVDAVGRLEDRERLLATFYFYEGPYPQRDRQSPGVVRRAYKPDPSSRLGQVREHLKGSPLEHDDGGGLRTLN